MKVVVILPTYNERENIISLLTKLRTSVGSDKRYQTVYVVVDDNSPDGTQDEILKYRKKYSDVHLITGQKKGLGKALLRGMEYAAGKVGAEIIVQMDADLSHDPAVVPQLLQKITEGYDFAVGSRYISGGSIPENWGLHRKLFSVLGNAIVRFGLGYPGVHDWTGGFRAYRRQFVTRISPEMDAYKGYVFQIAYLHKAIQSGATVSEVPIHFTDRRFGRSKIAPSEYIRNVIEYVLRQRYESVMTGPFRKFLIVGSIGFIINTVLLELFVKLGFDPTVGTAIGAECAIISNFVLNNRWTFKNRKIKGTKTVGKFIQFNITSLGALMILSVVVWLGTRLISMELYRIWYVFGVGIGLIWNYFMYSRVIWKKQ